MVAALIIRFFVIEAYRIPSHGDASRRSNLATPSSSPSGRSGCDCPFHLRDSLRVGRPNTAKSSFLQPGEPPRDSIRRVVGLAGDTVEMRSGHIFLNGAEITRQPDRNAICGEVAPPGAHYPVCWEPPIAPDFGPEKVPAESVFVIGDFCVPDNSEFDS